MFTEPEKGFFGTPVLTLQFYQFVVFCVQRSHPRPITGFVSWPNSKPLAVTWEVLFAPPRVRIAARWPGPSRWVRGGLSWPEWSFLNRLLRAISGAKLPEAEVTAAAAAEDAGVFSARVEDPLNSQETLREHSLPEKGPLGSQLPTLGSWEMLVHSHPRG